MTHVVASAETESWVTRRADPDDKWDVGDSAGRVTNVEVVVSQEEQSYYGSSVGRNLDVNVGDTVYAVAADYSSGCTFGRSGGHGQVLDVFTDPAEAQSLAEAALQIGERDYSFKHNNVEYRADWQGYFESLNSIDVWECTVKPHFAYNSFSAPHIGFKRGS